VKLLVRAQLETLGQLPAAVLTHLAGGQLKLSSPAARYLLDEQGAQLRLVVIDQGQVVGVGRQTRVAARLAGRRDRRGARHLYRAVV
jgi:hypothetical protein